MSKYNKIFEWLESLPQYKVSEKGLHRTNKVRGLKGVLNSASDFIKSTEPGFFSEKIETLSIHSKFNSLEVFSQDDVGKLIEMMVLMVEKIPNTEANKSLRSCTDLGDALGKLFNYKHLGLIDFEYNQYRIGDAKSFTSSIVDFGLIVVDGKTLEDLSTVSQLILPYPEMKMATYCKSMTGITDEMLVDKPSFNEFLPEFESLLNTYADMVFLHWGGIESSSLHKEFERCQKKVPISVVFYDLQPLVSRKFGERQISLKSAANLLNIELDLETHRAVNDAIYLGFILKALKSEYSA